MGFKIRRAFDWLLTLRWFDELAGHYDGLSNLPGITITMDSNYARSFTMDFENARLFTIILKHARPWAFNSSLRSIGPAARASLA